MNKSEKLTSLADQIKVCKKCNLYKSAAHSVPGEGNPEAKVVFVGEAPGFHEDSQGKPFVGNAGKYLNFLLSKVGLKREEVFITNVVKHRPPENRDPTYSEITACSNWLEEQISTISPKIIVTLGRWSLAHFLPEAKISDVHGRPVRSRGVTVLPMFHPAAALRSATLTKQLEEDFLKNRQMLVDPSSQEATPTFDESGQGSLF